MIRNVWERVRCVFGHHRFDVVVVAGSDPTTDEAWTLEMKVCRHCGHIDASKSPP